MPNKHEAITVDQEDSISGITRQITSIYDRAEALRGTVVGQHVVPPLGKKWESTLVLVIRYPDPS